MMRVTKRLAVTVSSAAVAGITVLGAGGTASADASAPARQSAAVDISAGDYRWDHGVGYLLAEQGYSWDEIRQGRVTCPAGHDRDGHLRRGDNEAGDWKSHTSHPSYGSRSEQDAHGQSHCNRIHGNHF